MVVNKFTKVFFVLLLGMGFLAIILGAWAGEFNVGQTIIGFIYFTIVSYWVRYELRNMETTELEFKAMKAVYLVEQETCQEYPDPPGV